MQRLLIIGVFVTFLAANAATTDEKRNEEKDLVVNVDLDEIPKEITIPIQGSKTLNGFDIDFVGTVRLRKQVSTASTPAPTFPPMMDSDIDDLIDKCYNGDIDGVKKMIHQFGPNQVVNAKYRSLTCLHYAAAYGHPNIITLLIENGADIDPKDDWGETPLRRAIKWRSYSSITTLIKLGADFEKTKESDFWQKQFESSMKDEKTKAAIEEGQRLADLEKAKESDYGQSFFDERMREEKTKAAIAEGKRLAGQIG